MIKNYDIENHYRVEVLRKAINLCSLVLPVVYFFITQKLTLQILAPLTAAFLVVDLARYYHQPTAAVFYRVFGFLLRKHERDLHAKSLNGATWFLIAATIGVAVFPKYIAVISFAVFSFADLASALIGRRFGRRRFNGRSLEGSAAFVVAGLLVIALAPKIEYRFSEYLICAAAVIIGALAEILSYNIIDDNLAIPLSAGAGMWLLYALIHPAMNLGMFGCC